MKKRKMNKKLHFWIKKIRKKKINSTKRSKKQNNLNLKYSLTLNSSLNLTIFKRILNIYLQKLKDCNKITICKAKNWKFGGINIQNSNLWRLKYKTFCVKSFFIIAKLNNLGFKQIINSRKIIV